MLLSNIEKNLDTSKYNLLNCKIYNYKLKAIRKLLGFDYNELSSIEDFSDDNISTRMSDDTKAIKDFYKLSIKSNILIHFQDICIEMGRENPPKLDSTFKNFLTRIFHQGDEATERLKYNETSCIKKIRNFFKTSSE